MSLVLTLFRITGWTILDRLYVFKGVVYLVTTDKENMPDIDALYSKAIFILPGKEAEDSRLPGDDDIRIVTPAQAKTIFGTKGAGVIDGLTVSSLSLTTM